MKISTKIVWNIESGAVIERHTYDYSGPIALLCGASDQEKAAFANEQKISNLLTTNFQEFAGKDSAILDNMIKSLSPIQAAGPSQFGLTPVAEAAERTSAAENISAAGAQASNAVRSAMASRGGGMSYLPSGSEAEIVGTIAQDTAVKEALAQSNITAKGFDIGRQNWEFATEGLTKAPGALESPITQAGGEAVTGAGQEQKGAEAITAANQAWMAPVAGIIGAGVKAATAGATGGASLLAKTINPFPGQSDAGTYGPS
jgi:hypothetical protein